MTKIVALIYHDVVVRDRADDSGFLGPDADFYKLEPEVFRDHLDCIRQWLDGRDPVLADSAAVGQGPAAPQVLLTFDDGGASASSCIADELQARQLLAHFFIPTACIGRKGFLSAAGIRDLAGRGHVVGSHSHDHPPRLSSLSHREILDQWTTSRQVLEDTLGREVPAASVPGGYFSPGVALAASEAGIRQLFTSEPVTAVQRLGELNIFGRFSITRATTRAQLGRLVRAEPVECLKQRGLWAAKRLAKQAGGETWLKVRRTVFNRGWMG